MAIEFCSENSALVMSPRISFSYDLSQSDTTPIEQTLLRSNSKTGNDFDFCIGENNENQSSSADELFSDGKIIPTQIKKNNSLEKQNKSPRQGNLTKPSDLLPKLAKIENGRKESNEGTKEKHNSKSFWGFKRSNSLNCGSGYAPSLCPLPLMSRSNSTGSANSNSKKTSISRENQGTQKLNLLKSSSHVASRSSSLKPPIKKSYSTGVNPALNVHSGNLFGLGSIFSNGKDKNKKK